MKKCWACKVEKEKTEFYKDARQGDCLQKSCKECQKERNKKYSTKNKQYFIDKNKENYSKKKDENPNYNQDRYQKDRDKFLERRKRYSGSIRGKLRQLMTSAKLRSKNKERDFDLDLDFMYEMFDRQGGKCALTNLEFTYKAGYNADTKSRYNPFNPSLDKIDANKGYTKDNVRLVLVIINLSLNSFGDSIFDVISRAYIANKYGVDIKPD
jgi:hypothetical protein